MKKRKVPLLLLCLLLTACGSQASNKQTDAGTTDQIKGTSQEQTSEVAPTTNEEASVSSSAATETVPPTEAAAEALELPEIQSISLGTYLGSFQFPRIQETLGTEVLKEVKIELEGLSLVPSKKTIDSNTAIGMSLSDAAGPWKSIYMDRFGVVNVVEQNQTKTYQASAYESCYSLVSSWYLQGMEQLLSAGSFPVLSQAYQDAVSKEASTLLYCVNGLCFSAVEADEIVVSRGEGPSVALDQSQIAELMFNYLYTTFRPSDQPLDQDTVIEITFRKNGKDCRHLYMDSQNRISDILVDGVPAFDTGRCSISYDKLAELLR